MVKHAVPAKLRLNRYLAMCGVCSRREADRLIAGGEVQINGQTVRQLGLQVDPARDLVRVHGEELRAGVMPAYIMLNKPAGVVTTARDEQGRPTVSNLVQIPLRVFAVGRLDRESEGLLLLTNDGDLSYRLMHPRFKVAKVYQVALNLPLDESAVRAFRQGIQIDRGKPVHGELRVVKAGDRRLCEVTISEGRNRQVRRMFAALGYRVKWLRRTHLGPLALGSLRVGAWRFLGEKEIKQLNQAVGLYHGNS